MGYAESQSSTRECTAAIPPIKGKGSQDRLSTSLSLLETSHEDIFTWSQDKKLHYSGHFQPGFFLLYSPKFEVPF